MLVATSDLSYFMRCRKWRPFGKDMPSGLLRICNTKQSPADRILLQVEVPFHCHREKQQGFTSLHSAVSHSVNEVGKHIYKWWLARWLYRTQADACRSRAIEWFIRLAHRCWSPLPTYRILCDAGSDDLLGRICHSVCSVSVTPSKARLIGFCDKRNTPIRCHRENLQGSTSLHFVGSHNGNGFRGCASSRRSGCWVTRTF